MKKKTVWISAAIAIVVAIPSVSAWAATSGTTASPAPTSITSDATAHAGAAGTAGPQDGRGGHFKGDRGGKGGPGQGAPGQGGPGKGGPGQGGPGKGHGGEGFMGGGFHADGVKGSANSEEYLTLLAEKYAPDQTSAIKAAFDEKASLEKQFQDLMTKNKAVLDQKRADEKAKIDAIQAKVTSGELTKAQAEEQIKALRDASHPEKAAPTADQTAERDAEKALHDSFDAAVQTVVDGGSADQLTQILPKIVENLKAENKELSDHIAQMQSSVAAG